MSTVSHICPMCEQPTLARLDDEELCFSCDYRGVFGGVQAMEKAPAPQRVPDRG